MVFIDFEWKGWKNYDLEMLPIFYDSSSVDLRNGENIVYQKKANQILVNIE